MVKILSGPWRISPAWARSSSSSGGQGVRPAAGDLLEVVPVEAQVGIGGQIRRDRLRRQVQDLRNDKGQGGADFHGQTLGAVEERLIGRVGVILVAAHLGVDVDAFEDLPQAIPEPEAGEELSGSLPQGAPIGRRFGEHLLDPGESFLPSGVGREDIFQPPAVGFRDLRPSWARSLLLAWSRIPPNVFCG